MKKLVKILSTVITEQLDFLIDPKTGKDLPKNLTLYYDPTTLTPSVVDPTNIENEPLPPLGNLNQKTKNCLNDVLSQPQFKGKWNQIGGYANRNIAGETTKSEHAFGNALDFHGKTSDVMQTLADYLVSNATRLEAKNVIYNRKIWNSPRGWHPYTGQNPHIDHVHVDFIR